MDQLSSVTGREYVQPSHSELMQKDESSDLVLVQAEQVLRSVVRAVSVSAFDSGHSKVAESTMHQYGQVLESLGMMQLAGVLRMSALPEPYYVTPYEYWDFTRVIDSMRVATPPSVFFRCEAAYRQQVPCMGLVLVEQHTVEPEVRVEQVVKERIVYVPRPRQHYDPVLLFMLPFSEDLALPFVAGVWNH